MLTAECVPYVYASLEVADDAFIIMDDLSRIMVYNKAAALLFGADCKGRLLTEFIPVGVASPHGESMSKFTEKRSTIVRDAYVPAVLVDGREVRLWTHGRKLWRFRGATYQSGFFRVAE